MTRTSLAAKRCLVHTDHRSPSLRAVCSALFLRRLAVPPFALLAMLLICAVGVAAQWPGLLPLQAKAAAGYLGVKLMDIDPEHAANLKLSETTGVEITNVMASSPADQAGIRPGDVILSYNGEKVLGAQQFTRLVSETPPGRRVRLVGWRSGTEKAFTITTGVRPTGYTTSDDVELTRMRIIDVPLPMMLWRNLVLGIESGQLNDQLAQALGVKQGILVWTVMPAYPAQHAGLRAGDVLTQFCGHAINSPRDLGIILQQLPNEQKPISVDLMRDHKPVSLRISLEAEQ